MILLKFLLILILYPAIMSMYWTIGSSLYFIRYELFSKSRPIPSDLKGITFVVACFNEQETLEETLTSLVHLDYPLKEIIMVNDGSTDYTAAKLTNLKSRYDFKFINLKENKGKANALNEAVKEASYDYVLCIDADTVIFDGAPQYMMAHMLNDSSIGAVTGNPRIRNKDSMLGKIQVVEYASIIGGIKRAQSLAGAINTVSGVFTLFRKEALEDVGLFDTDMITEDIAMSWKLHLNDWKILYEPRAMCFMLVPETLGGLWKQRVRWSQGGHEVIIRDFKNIIKKGQFPLYLLLLESLLSILWIYIILLTLFFTVMKLDLLNIFSVREQLSLLVISALILTFFNIIQFLVALFIDVKYERRNIIGLLFLSWYPTVYWLINGLVVLFALPKALKRKKGEFATWTSPDRGDIQ